MCPASGELPGGGPAPRWVVRAMKSVAEKRNEVKPGGRKLAGVRSSVVAHGQFVDGAGGCVAGGFGGPGAPWWRPSVASSLGSPARARKGPRWGLGLEVGGGAWRGVVGLVGRLVKVFVGLPGRGCFGA